MKRLAISVVVLLAFFAYGEAVAQKYFSPPDCVPRTINSDELDSLPSTLTLLELRQKLPGGCLTGLAALTYLLVNENGETIAFWLSNKPEIAYAVLLDAEESTSIPNVNVFMGTSATNQDAEWSIIWPRHLKNYRVDEVAQRELIDPVLSRDTGTENYPVQVEKDVEAARQEALKAIEAAEASTRQSKP